MTHSHPADPRSTAAGARAIAVIGMSCRFPGAADPGRFRELLRAGRSAIADPPPERAATAPQAAGGPLPGGFVDADAFDPEPFGIAPREAAAMDPRQRLMLELAWEAVENAGVPVRDLHGTRTGVFVGAMSDDFAARWHRRGPGAATAHTLTGHSRAVIANRVSYALGLHGPSLAVDTGQSSSLVSVQLAMESLRRGESELAVAGGVHLNLAAESAAGEQRLGALSPDGRCYVFDARANGFVRGEGGGAVVLKPLPTALADGDRIHAVLLGGAVNSDGATSGLTVPGRHGQEDVLHQAYRDAGIDPAAVGYVELHGTGTPTGDPVEAAALGTALGAARAADDPLPVGSVKTNIGHLGAAAGIAGLIKTALGVRDAELVPSLNFTAPNPDIALDRLGLRVQLKRADWPRAAGRPVAGVSSFGIGGTNCHLVLAAPEGTRRETGSGRAVRVRGAGRGTDPVPLPFVFSAAGGAGLRGQAEQLGARVADAADADLPELAAALALTRSPLARRAAVVAADREELAGGLAAVARGSTAATVRRGMPRGGGAAMLFSGLARPYAGMGRRLHAHHPAFARAFDEVCAGFDPLVERPLRDVVWARPGSAQAALLERAGWAQPALFAVGTALYRLLEAWGVRPDFVAGHSLTGEAAAAHAAGMLPLADACALVAAGARELDGLADAVHAGVGADAAAAAALLASEGLDGRVAVAAVGGPGEVVLSGDRESTVRAVRLLAAHGAEAPDPTPGGILPAPRTERAVQDLLAAARGLDVRPACGPEPVSGLTGGVVGPEQLADPEHWARHAREAVRLADGVAALHERGARVFCELGPGSGIAEAARDCVAARAEERKEARSEGGAAFLSGLRSGAEERAAAEYVAGLHVNGIEPDWQAMLGAAPRHVELPTYAFRHRAFGLGPEAPEAGTAASAEEERPARAAGPETAGAHEGADTHRALLRLVQAETAAVLGHDSPEAVDTAASFHDMGLDSMLAVALRNRLTRATGRDLPVTLLFDAPTPDQVAFRLRDEQPARPGAVRAGAEARRSDEAGDRIAIVGAACRLPGGVDTPEKLWDLVSAGADATSEFPGNRGWDLDGLYDPDPGAPGRSHVRRGGFVHDADEFDAGFFGISPREAQAMDPQQRLLLETAWQALERAGIRPSALRGRSVGVFVGAMVQEYGPRLHEPVAGSEGHLLTGSLASVASGRIAYTFGFEGPAVTVDTACSSSLVALHQAMQALRRGECEIALVGGATVMASPGVFTEFSTQRGLAPDGRCKPYSAGADGTGWSEGAGLIVLERLADAAAAGRTVWGVLRGSAVNQDGASNGLSAPSGRAQERVLRAALADAGIGPEAVGVVEGHGTGTRLGDPIEARAVGAVYGAAGPGVVLGSVKAGIGHTQAAAGVAGVISLVGTMGRGMVPAMPGAGGGPSELVDWSGLGVEPALARPRPWPDRRGGVRIGGVSSFGISGTNAHVLIEEPPRELAYDFAAGAPAAPPGARAISPGAPPEPEGAAEDPWLQTDLVAWPVTAAAPDALGAQAARLRSALERDPAARAADIGLTLSRHRTHFAHRAVVLAAEHAGFRGGLAALEEGASRAGDALVVQGSAERPGAPVFVFGGQGAQWPGMGAELMTSSPVFRARIAECEQALAPHVDFSLGAVLCRLPCAPSLDRVDVVQPALWAVMVALADVWRSAGVEPAAVVGHSQGEVAAACVSGALSLEDAAAVVALRSRAVGELVGGGAMGFLGESPERTAERTAVRTGRAHIAAVNGPAATVVAGDAEAVAELVGAAEAEGVRARMIEVGYASHTPHVESARERIRTDLAGIAPRSGTVPFFSAVTGAELDGGALDADYWYANLREPVRFGSAVEALIAAGHGLFLESGPHPVLTAAIEDTLAAGDADGAALGTLRRDEGGPRRLLASLAEAFVRGVPVDFGALASSGRARRVDLPSYAFHRTRYWLAQPRTDADPGSLGQAGTGHALLGAVVDLADGGAVCTGRLALREAPWLADHAVGGRVLLPGAAVADLAVCAGDRAGCPDLEELVLEEPLVLGESAADGAAFQVVLAPADEQGRRDVGVYSRPEGTDGDWRRHASGSLRPAAAPDAERRAAAAGLGAWPPAGADPVDVDGAYETLAARGHAYGPAFRGLRALWRRGDEILAEVALPEEHRQAAHGFGLHPALLDAALQALAAAAPVDGPPRVPHTVAGFRIAAVGATSLRVRITPRDGASAAVDMYDPQGALVAELDRVTLRPMPEAPLSRAGELYAFEWTAAEGPASQAPDQEPAWAFLGVAGRLAASSAADTAYADLDELRSALDAGAPPPSAVVAECPGADRFELHRDATKVAHRVLAVVREWVEDARFAGSVLVLRTRGAVAATAADRLEGLHQTPAWGLVRTAQSEHPGRFVLVDDDAAGHPADVLRRAAATRQPQVALRGGRIYVPRLVPAAAPAAAPPKEDPWRLDVAEPGSLDAVGPQPAPGAQGPLGRGRVRVAVRAAGVNFRDVVVALGLLPGETGMGSEGAGVVTEVGPGVDDLAVGDRVLGMFEGAFGPQAVAERTHIAAMPRDWSFAHAAGVPVAYLSAYYALVDLARVRPGESVLVHAAAGGVGTAAVALARHLGAEVFATASPAKQPLLRAMGLDDSRIASSRSREFAERFAASGGVDVVLNALAGDYVDASLGLLAQGGRFVEMGKTDLRRPEQVAARHPGRAYLPFNLPDVPATRIQRILGEVVDLLEAGRLGPEPPLRRKALHDAPAALRELQQGATVGKTVLALPRPLDPEGTVLVTGGTGTLGAALARHLVAAHGAGRLLLTSRGGPMAPGAMDLVCELTGLGAEVEVRACDVTDRAAVAELLEDIPQARPLTAVVHAAGVLDDATLGELTPKQLDRALAPKVDGAWHLHELTAGADLSAFVLFSSALGTLGGAGQANYAAANAFLDGLAYHRNARGRAATSLSWGLWEQDSTMTGRMGAAELARMRRLGVEPMSTARGLELFDAALALDRPHLVPARLSEHKPQDARSGNRARRAAAQAPAGTAAHRSEFVSADLPADELRAALLDLVREHAAAVLGHGSGTALRPDKQLTEAGIDSLTAVELRNRLNTATGLRLPATVLYDHPTPQALAAQLAARLRPDERGSAEPAPPAAAVPVSAAEGADAGQGGGEDTLTRLLDAVRTVPLDRLRESGIAGSLLDLARTGPETRAAREAPVSDDGAQIESMSVDDLVGLALTEDELR
ncbi:type I polyketide synthase [Streptomonospora alba]|uniref:type I polyketide synthase n=1 Tax=Streptomonospora alba TaxID=183763 RepID=UPI0019310890|nr:type I polyketide synthase [Streptomonospora alba]